MGLSNCPEIRWTLSVLHWEAILSLVDERVGDDIDGEGDMFLPTRYRRYSV